MSYQVALRIAVIGMTFVGLVTIVARQKYPQLSAWQITIVPVIGLAGIGLIVALF